jgi:hypothetical protein
MWSSASLSGTLDVNVDDDNGLPMIDDEVVGHRVDP